MHVSACDLLVLLCLFLCVSALRVNDVVSDKARDEELFVPSVGVLQPAARLAAHAGRGVHVADPGMARFASMLPRIQPSGEAPRMANPVVQFGIAPKLTSVTTSQLRNLLRSRTSTRMADDDEEGFPFEDISEETVAEIEEMEITEKQQQSARLKASHGSRRMMMSQALWSFAAVLAAAPGAGFARAAGVAEGLAGSPTAAGSAMGTTSAGVPAAPIMAKGQSGFVSGTNANLDWRFFAAGGIAAAASHGYTTPIDVVKTKIQTDPKRYNGSLPTALARVVKDQGIVFLFQGLAPTVVGYGTEGALKFGVYELCKPLLEMFSPDLDRTLRELLAAFIAGAIASLVLCPAEDVRIRLVADPSYASSSLSALERLSRENGPFASFAGFPAMAAKQVPYTMGKQVGFDIASRLVRAATAYLLFSLAEDAPERELAARVAPLVAALPAAVTAAILSHPGDMVLTEYYKSSGASSVPDALDSIVKRGGFGGLFTGLRARLVHVVSIICVQLVIYDKIKVFLGLPATGSD